MTAPETWTRYTRALPGAHDRLLCFPYAGGGAAAFRAWVGELAASGTEVWPVQLPGRENRLGEPPVSDLPRLVAELADVFEDRLDELPYTLFGHSMGARVAFELAHELRRRDRPPPRLLIVSAHRPPHRLDPDPPAHALPRDRFLARLRTYGGVSEAVLAEPSLLDLMLPVVRADFALFERHPWQPEPLLGCPMTVLGGRTDARVPAAELTNWAELTEGPCELRMFDGGHFFLAESPHQVVGAVRDAILRTREGTGHVGDMR
ncbi:alpha/beta fold hydrolase [Nonomuraea sp. NPDC048916]|uniref:thioesterase II family protein n=1 Tax=Nonomuraea sp. NPDC048916 TaxID=3154232 RepID=UPI0034063B59